MRKTFSLFKQVTGWALVLVLCLVVSPTVIAQHEGHVMGGVAKPKPRTRRVNTAPKRKARRRAKQRRTSRSTKPAKLHTPSVSSGHKHTPGMMITPAITPATPTPNSQQARPTTPETAAPHTHIPGMPMPESSPAAQPQSSPQHEMHAPPPSAAKPSAGTSPNKMDMQTPMSHPSPEPATKTHDSMAHPETDESKPAGAMTETHASGAHEMNMGPLLVMSGDDLSIRVGASDTNAMPMGRMSSGTSWQPASTQTNMLHKASGEWLLMFHYNAVIGINSQGGPRGVTKFESANWFMPMAFRKVGPGTLELRGMFSLEPFTFAPGGSPLLFQTGETYKGRPIIDAQHPHDLFMELSASYTVPVSDRATWFVYFGYPGEPALGPTAFMHRASASENPAPALSHHLQDSSHISFGVLTSGFTFRWFKLEGSLFNGREPDEDRYNFDAHRWNSRSARLSIAPNRNWSMQISHGLLRDPEAQEPGDVRRTTASISYNQTFERGHWASSLIWGRNHENHRGEVFNLNGYIAESTLNFLDKNYLYTRLELVDKNALLRDADRLRLGIAGHHPSFRIGAYTFGGARDVWTTKQLSMAIGGDVTFYSKPGTLDAIYGANPTSYRLFLRFRPSRMDMGSMHGP